MATLSTTPRAGSGGPALLILAVALAGGVASAPACARRAPTGGTAESASPSPVAASASGPASSATSATLGEQQRRRGASYWAFDCAACHGPEGEAGRGGARRVTVAALPKTALPISTARLAGFANAHELMVYVREHMPRDIAGELPADEYWDVLAFVLARYGVELGDAPLDEPRAKTLRLGATYGDAGRD